MTYWRAEFIFNDENKWHYLARRVESDILLSLGGVFLTGFNKAVA